MAGVKPLVAAGFIIFRHFKDQIQYLLLQTSYGEHHWTPPKGHVDPGESEFQTALRETQEEAGLVESQLIIIENFQKVLNYEVKGRPKRVVYWLSELKDPLTKIILSEEHQGFKWLNYSETLNYAKYKDMQEAYKEVDDFIKQNCCTSKN